MDQSIKLRKLPNYQRVYVNPDCCFLDRREDKKLRDIAKRLRKDHPEKKVFVKNGKVIVDDEVFFEGNPLHQLFLRPSSSRGPFRFVPDDKLFENDPFRNSFSNQ